MIIKRNWSPMDHYVNTLVSPLGIVMFLIGLFYCFAGWMLGRSCIQNNLLDTAISAIGLTKIPAVDVWKMRWLTSLAIVNFGCGVSLLALSLHAPWLFGLSFGLQVFYLIVLAPFYFDKHDEVEEKIRDRSMNATILFGVVTMGVVFTAYSGGFLTFPKIERIAGLIVLIATLCFAAWLIYNLRFPSHNRENREELDED